MEIQLRERLFRIEEYDEERLRASAHVECNVDTDKLKLRVGELPIDGGEPNQGVEINERGELSHFFTVMVNILSFLIDVPIRFSHRIGNDQLIVETEEDRQKLDLLGTSRIYQRMSVSLSLRSVSLSTMVDDALEKLYQRGLGVALYRQALLLQEPIGVYREFWKVLESAFGAKDRRLIQLLSKYKPASNIGFSEEELRGLLILRGRASHAESKKGVHEFHDTNSQISEALPRLKSLVEQVIVTKKTWGTPTLETDRVAELVGYTNEDGTPILYQSSRQ
ncbi:hypothetical protein [Candidatus Leptofilum sp.]|uniref:hypothetical protein n=1 Tax=Candidatus Leptofilum sp. TaxID=3241576 RepID=UPI003B5948B1